MTDLDAIRERVECPSAVQAVRIGEYEACARVIVEHDAPALLAENEKSRDLRARIEALRDEFRSNIDWSDGRNNYGDNEAWESAADALDALLREGE